MLTHFLVSPATAAWPRSYPGDGGPRAKSLSPGELLFLLSALAPSLPVCFPQQVRDGISSVPSLAPCCFLASGSRGSAGWICRRREACSYSTPGFWFSLSGHHAGCRYDEFSWSQIPLTSAPPPQRTLADAEVRPQGPRGTAQRSSQTGRPGASELVAGVGCGWQSG